MSDYPYTASQLSAYRSQTDPYAEKIVNELYKHYKLKEVDFLFRQIPNHIENNNFPDFFRDYIEKLGDLPDWIDMEKIHKGQEVFWSYGREVILALLCRSLPMCYICANGSEVLTTTARLIDFPSTPKYTRRLLETLQFVVNISSDQSKMDKLGVGLITIKKVRLIHATIRRYIQENEEWPTEERGAPINQEDQLITMSAFGMEVLKSLAKMGIHLDEASKEAWCHIWFVTGYLLGIEENLLPDSYAACDTMSQRILSTQERKSDPGLALTKSCIEFMSDLLPFHILNSFTYSVFKYLNDEEHREAMGLTKKHWLWDWVMPKLMKSTIGIDQKLEKRSKILKFIISYLNKWLIKGLLKKMLRDEKYFYLPPSLKG